MKLSKEKLVTCNHVLIGLLIFLFLLDGFYLFFANLEYSIRSSEVYAIARGIGLHVGLFIITVKAIIGLFLIRSINSFRGGGYIAALIIFFLYMANAIRMFLFLLSREKESVFGVIAQGINGCSIVISFFIVIFAVILLINVNGTKQDSFEETP